MTKKILLTIFLIFTILFSLCSTNVLATETIAALESENITTTGESTTTQTTTQEPEIHKDDLYVFGNDVVMDKLVDGNVYILGNTVDFSGQVNGSLFILANKVYFNGACNDLYVCCNNLEMTYDSYVIRNVKAISSSSITCKAAIGRDVSLLCNTLNLGENEDIPLIYGNLNYISNKEISVPEGVMASNGTVNYTNNTLSIINVLISFAGCIVTVITLYFIFKKVTPGFVEKLAHEKLPVFKILRALVIGFVSLALVLILTILLSLIGIGIKLGAILIMLYAILCIISVPSLAIIITNLLKPILKVEKNYLFNLILILISIILHGISLIPLIGIWLGIIIKLIAIGLIINMYLPRKELTFEEKEAIKEAKELKRENKKNLKQEKLEAKAIKKQEKLEKKDK